MLTSFFSDSVYLLRPRCFFTRNIFFLIGIVSLFCRNDYIMYKFEDSCKKIRLLERCETVNNNNAYKRVNLIWRMGDRATVSVGQTEMKTNVGGDLAPVSRQDVGLGTARDG